MENNDLFKKYDSYVAFRVERYGKSTLFENEHLLVGLNCFKPGQEMAKHAHAVQSRFYIVLEGNGQVLVGEELKEAEKGTVIWVPAGQAHRIINSGAERLVMLVGIAPSKGD